MKKCIFFIYSLFLIMMPVSLQALAIIDGTVTDSVTGDPIEGVFIEVRRNNQIKGTDTTIADGTYSISALSPGNQYTVTATKAGCQTQIIPINFLQNNQTTTIDFALVPDPGTISGTVTDSSTTDPIVGATVKIFQGPTLIATDTTIGGGGYSVETLAPGNYQVVVSASGYTGKSTGAIVTAGGTTVVDFALDPLVSAGEISGTVTDITPSDIEGALVEVFDDQMILVGSDITIADGTYAIPGLTPGSYTVRATVAGFQTANVGAVIPPAGGPVTVNFVLAASPGTISGTVEDTLTNPISNALIQVFQGLTLISSTLSDPSGDYTIIGLAPGSYTVKATAADCQEATVGATVTAGATTTVNFALASNPGTISGTVEDTSTDSIPGALVEVFLSPTFITSTLTDPSGAYIIPGLALDDYTVEVMAAGFQDATDTATVTEGATTIVNFVLAASPGTISGTVTDTAGPTAIEGATVQIFQSNTLITSALTDASGDYSISGFAPGDYTVVAQAPDFQIGFKPATVTAGGITDVDFTLESGPGTLTGKVVGECTSNNLPGVTVSVFDGPTLIAFGLTDSNGIYNIPSIPVGTFTVKAGGTNFVQKSAVGTVATGETVVVDFNIVPKALAPASISGRVIQDRYLAQTDVVHAIEWQASPSPLCVTGYKVYRNGTLIGTVAPGGTLEFLDHRRNDKVDNYSVETVNQFGQVSVPATITLR